MKNNAIKKWIRPIVFYSLMCGGWATAHSLMNFKIMALLTLIAYVAFCIGTFLNILVMALNNWRMPVSLEKALLDLNQEEINEVISYVEKSPEHSLMNDRTRLKFLADIFFIEGNIVSIGDCILSISFCLIVISAFSAFLEAVYLFLSYLVLIIF